jgi:hypothetical protein
MRIFHIKVHEGYIFTGQPVYTSPSLSNLLGSVDMLDVSGYTSQVSGSSPTIEVQDQISMDGENWTGGAIPILGASTSLNLSGETLFQGQDYDTDISYNFGAKPAFVRLKITVGGAGANAMVRIWVTGRDRSRRARALARGA